jgi:hypothetical protein
MTIGTKTRPDRVGDDHHAVRGVLLRLRLRLPRKAAVRPRRDVAHVLRPEDGGHLRREREDPDMTQQFHAKRRVLANELDEPLVLNRWHVTNVHAYRTCIRLLDINCIAFELVVVTRCHHRARRVLR